MEKFDLYALEMNYISFKMKDLGFLYYSLDKECMQNKAVL